MTEVRGFGFNPGALRMFIYVPDGLPEGAPLVVVLHGCTQRAEAHAAAAGWLTLADRLGFAVLAPEQEAGNNPNRCFNWFEPAHARRGAGEAASIRAMVAHVIQTHSLDAGQVFVTGLSAGGAMAAVMLAAYPEVFAAGAVIAGLPYGAADNLQEALSLMHGGRTVSDERLGALVRAAAPATGRLPRVSVWHGDLDHTVSPGNAQASARQWAAAHGLPARPTEVETLPGRVRSVWRAADGEAVVETQLVAGLGHGTPLATGGPDGVGSAAPFMLETDVSSSLEVARFWGLAPPAVAGAALAPQADPQADPQGAPQPGGVAQAVLAAVSPHVPAEVQASIERAMKSAGLMR